MLAYVSLLDGVRARARFTEIYEQNYAKMYYLARRLVGDDAEDVVQEAFLRLASDFERYESLEPGRMEALCVTITKHLAIDLLRRNKRLADESEAILWTSAEDKACMEELVEARELSHKVTDVLRTLPESLQCVLWLKYYLEYSNREIAKTLGISEKNVEMRLYRGRKKLAGFIHWAKPEE